MKKIPKRYLMGYLPIKIKVIVIIKIITDVDKFDGKMSRTIIDNGNQSGKIEYLNFIFLF